MKYLLTLSLFFLWPVYATADVDECYKIYIEINNQSGQRCLLVTKQLEHGRIMGTVPMSLPDGYAGHFTTSGNGLGMRLRLTYDCGGRRATFESVESPILGVISANVLAANGLNISYEVLDQSYLYNTAGAVSWTLS